MKNVKHCGFLHDQKFINGKDNFTKFKNSLNLLYDDKKYYVWKRELVEQKDFSFDKKFPILF